MEPDPSSDVSLSSIFRERCTGEPPAGDAEMEAVLRRMFEEGQRAWPGLGLPPDAFVRHLASRGARGTPLAALHAADLYLACACEARARGAVEAFERAYLGQVGVFLARTRPSPAVVDEVRQVLREKLFVGRPGAAPKIVEYDGRGALASWVRVIAIRAAIDLKRQSRADEDGAGPAPDAQVGPDPERGYFKGRYGEAFNDAIRSAVRALAAEQ